MQLRLPGFDEEKSKKEMINESIASNLTIMGFEGVSGLDEALGDILQSYEFEKGVFKLRSEVCVKCRNKLKRKGTYQKEITLPGGARILLSFYQYSCPHCKKKVDR